MTPLSNDQISQKVNAAIAEYLEIAATKGAPPKSEPFLARYPDIANQLKEFLDDYQAAKPTGPQPKPKRDPPINQSLGGKPNKAADAIVSVQATCPNGHLIRVSRSWAGRRAKCPKCKAVFVVPTPGRTVAAAQDVTPTGRPGVIGETLSFKTSGRDDASVSDVIEKSPATRCASGGGNRFGQFELVAASGRGRIWSRLSSP